MCVFCAVCPVKVSARHVLNVVEVVPSAHALPQIRDPETPALFAAVISF